MLVLQSMRAFGLPYVFQMLLDSWWVLQMSFCRFWRFYTTGQPISGVYDNDVMVQLLYQWVTCSFVKFWPRMTCFWNLKLFGNVFGENKPFERKGLWQHAVLVLDSVLDFRKVTWPFRSLFDAFMNLWRLDVAWVASFVHKDFLFAIFRLKEAETTNRSTEHNKRDTLLGWLGEKNALCGTWLPGETFAVFWSNAHTASVIGSLGSRVL